MNEDYFKKKAIELGFERNKNLEGEECFIMGHRVFEKKEGDLKMYLIDMHDLGEIWLSKGQYKIAQKFTSILISDTVAFNYMYQDLLIQFEQFIKEKENETR